MKGKELMIYAAAGLVPVIWMALLAAPCMDGGLVTLMEKFPDAIASPFSIRMCKGSMKTVLIAIAAYAMAIGIYVSTRRNYRRGEEMGSAK